MHIEAKPRTPATRHYSYLHLPDDKVDENHPRCLCEALDRIVIEVTGTDRREENTRLNIREGGESDESTAGWSLEPSASQQYGTTFSTVNTS